MVKAAASKKKTSSRKKSAAATAAAAPNINTTATARTPLADREPIQRDDYQQQECPPIGKIIIRGDGSDNAFLSAIKKTLNASVPTTPNTTVGIGKTSTLLWLGPNEWLLWGAQADQKIEPLTTALKDQHAAVVNVSDYYTIIRISGKKAQQVLAHGCPLDLRDSRLPTGSCAQTHYRNAGILLHRAKTHYDLQIRSSYAQYLWDYLAAVSER